MIQPESTPELVRRAKEGDAAALEALVRRHLRAAFAMALAIVRRPADAEEVAQDAVMVALEKLESCRDPERFSAWLLRIARNRALDLVKQRRGRELVLAEWMPMSGDVQGSPESSQLRQSLLEGLMTLSELQRQVVLLHDLEGMTHAEIADACQLSEVASRQHLFQARRLLRQELAAEERGEDDR